MPEPSSKQSSSTRRGLIGGLGVAGAGLVVGAAGSPAQATQGQPIIAGELNTATQLTNLWNRNGWGLDVSANGLALNASSDNSWGVYGSSRAADPSYAGVVGENQGGGDGVQGRSTLKNGVYGLSQYVGATGVYGDNDAGGFGVVGRSTGTGVGVWANSPNGTALRTTGKLEIQNRSGVATITSGKTSVTVTLAGVTTASMVLATVQGTGGFFASATPKAGSFTLTLNKAPVSPATVKVAYLVLN